MVLRLPEERWAVRHYLEFFLTPAGTFSAVPTMLQMEPKRSVEPPLSQSFGEDVDLVLLVRHYAVGGEMSAWKPTASIWLVLDPASPEDGAPS
jgi:hypothetical protein